MSARGYDDIAVFGFPINTAGPVNGIDQRFTNYIGKPSSAGGHRGPPLRRGFASNTAIVNGIILGRIDHMTYCVQVPRRVRDFDTKASFFPPRDVT